VVEYAELCCNNLHIQIQKEIKKGSQFLLNFFFLFELFYLVLETDRYIGLDLLNIGRYANSKFKITRDTRYIDRYLSSNIGIGFK